MTWFVDNVLPLLILGTVVVWLLVEAYLLAHGLKTISERIVEADRQDRKFGHVIVLTAGILIGHWFFT